MGGGGIHTVTPTVLTRLACRYLRLVLLEAMNVEGGTSLQNSCMDELRQEGSNLLSV